MLETAANCGVGHFHATSGTATCPYIAKVEKEAERDTYRARSSRSLRVLSERAQPGGLVRYDIEYRLELENTAEEPVVVSGWITDVFVGTLSDLGSGATPSALPVGSPGSRFNASGAVPGAVEWTNAGTTGALLSTAQIASPWNQIFEQLGPRISRGGRGTGPLKKDGRISTTEVYFVSAKPGSYVGFVTSVCFNDCRKVPDDLYHCYNLTLLGAKDESGASK